MFAVFHAMRHANETGGERTILRVALVLTTCGHRGDGRTMIIAITIEDLVLLAAIALVRDLTDDLEALLVRL